MVACKDWAKRLQAGRSIIPAPKYKSAADNALLVFKRLRVGDLPGKPTFGECCEPWVFDFVAAVFGNYEQSTGIQHINEYALLIAKKNTKSTIAAGIMLTALLLSWRENEEHLILAPTREVALNSFLPACMMIDADPQLRKMFSIQDSTRTITHRLSKNTLKIVTSTSRAVSGKKSGRILVDEFWLFGTMRGAPAMFMEALGGQISRKDAFTIFLSTQSDEPPAGIFRDKLDYWRKVRDGIIDDPRVLPILYEFPQSMIDDESYLLPKHFHITNPNLGRSVDKHWIERGLAQVRGRDDGSFQQFIAKHLNVEIGQNLRSDRWPGADFWPHAADKSLTLQDLVSRSEVVTVGIDGGGMSDLLSLAVLGRDADTKRILHWSHSWVNRAFVARHPEVEGKFRNFQNDRDLTLVDNTGDDIIQLCEYVNRVKDLLPSANAVGVDPAGIGQIVDALMSDDVGLSEDQIIGVPQGWRLNGPIKSTERMLAENRIVHCGSPLMGWAVGNAKITQRGNAVSITKRNSALEKIDPLMATFDAMVMMNLAPVAQQKSRRKRALCFTLGGV